MKSLLFLISALVPLMVCAADQRPSSPRDAINRVKDTERQTSPRHIDDAVKPCRQNMSRSQNGSTGQNKSRFFSLPKPTKVMSQSHKN